MSLLGTLRRKMGLSLSDSTGGTGAPAFTIIIPTLNPGPKLRASLESVTSQEDATFEILVIDGDSIDGTEALVTSCSGPIRYLKEDRRGVYAAMNLGVRESRGQILYFLGAGDRLRPGVLNRVAGLWPRAREVFLYGDVWMEDMRCHYDGEFTSEKLRKKNICHQAIFYSRSLFSRHGQYEECYPYLADYAFNLRVFGDKSVKRMHVPIVIADYEGDGLSANNPDTAFQAAKSALCDRHLGPTGAKSSRGKVS